MMKGRDLGFVALIALICGSQAQAGINPAMKIIM